jgi:hypothetical protein
MTPLRARLMDPANAVLDSGIDLSHPPGIKGYPRPAPGKPAQRTLPSPLPGKPRLRLAHPAPPYVWPGNLCGEFWLSHPTEDIPRPTLTIKYIVAVVSLVFGVEVVDILSQRRAVHIVRPRQVAMLLAKRLTLHSYPEIGRRMGGRDHTTVMHAVKKLTPIADEVASRLDDSWTVHVWARAVKARLEA